MELPAHLPLEGGGGVSVGPRHGMECPHRDVAEWEAGQASGTFSTPQRRSTPRVATVLSM